MRIFHKSIVPLAAFAALALPVQADAQSTSPAATPGSTTTLGQQIALPPAYESVTSSLGAIATSGAATLQLNRSGARALAIRTALSKALLNAGASVTAITTLDKSDSNVSLEDAALLCAPRQSYVVNSVSLNYLNTLVQNINSVSALPAAPTDIASALALLLAKFRLFGRRQGQRRPGHDRCPGKDGAHELPVRLGFIRCGLLRDSDTRTRTRCRRSYVCGGARGRCGRYFRLSWADRNSDRYLSFDPSARTDRCEQDR